MLHESCRSIFRQSNVYFTEIGRVCQEEQGEDQREQTEAQKERRSERQQKKRTPIPVWTGILPSSLQHFTFLITTAPFNIFAAQSSSSLMFKLSVHFECVMLIQ